MPISLCCRAHIIRWKRNEDFPECLGCKGSNTREHYFTQASSRPCGSVTSAIIILRLFNS